MAREIKVRGVRRKQIDEEKLAYAFMLLARSMVEEATQSDQADDSARKPEEPEQTEAA